MDKRSLENTVVDEILSQAFAEAAEREFENIEKVYREDVLSEKYLKIEKRAYEKYARRGQGRKASMLTLKRVAGIAVAIIALSAILLSIPTVRAGFAQLIRQTFDGYAVMKDDIEPIATEGEFKDYAIEYIPEGFRLDVNGSKNPRTMKFVSEGGGSFTIKAYSKGNFQFTHDTDHSVIEDVKINGNSGFLCYTELSEDYVLVWADDKKDFLIMGNIPREEILKIAKSVKYIGE